MNLYLVRHGQTDLNKKNIIQGITNAKLNDIGINQAKNLQSEIDKLDIDLVISSPLIRTKETTNIILNNRNIPIIYDDRIIERYAGDLEGKRDELYDHIKAWDYKLNTDLNANIEKVRDLLTRAKLFLNDIKLIIVVYLNIKSRNYLLDFFLLFFFLIFLYIININEIITKPIIIYLK